jgi:hypothetical protein
MPDERRDRKVLGSVLPNFSLQQNNSQFGYEPKMAQVRDFLSPTVCGGSQR